MTIERYWINAPSTAQDMHPHHGLCVHADPSTSLGPFTRVYPASGPIISMECRTVYLCPGWPEPEPKDLSDLETAFLLGFMVTREGFNGECPYDHCAPDDLELSNQKTPIKEELLQLKQARTIPSLLWDAINWIKQNPAG